MRINRFIKLTAAMLGCMFAMTLATSCDDDDEPASETTELKFSVEEVTLAPEAKDTVVVSDGEPPYTVVSSDDNIATVQVNNDDSVIAYTDGGPTSMVVHLGNIITVTGVKEGKATVTVTDKHKKKGTFSVTVK